MKGRQIQAHSALRNFFGDRLVYEAKADLAVVPIADDIKKAVKHNPTECVFAQACKRAYGANIAVFFRHYAYIELVDPRTDKPRVYRYAIGTLARQAIAAFDNGRGAKLGAFILTAPTPSATLEEKARYRREHPKSKDKNKGLRPRRKPMIQHRGRVSALAKQGAA